MKEYNNNNNNLLYFIYLKTKLHVTTKINQKEKISIK